MLQVLEEKPSSSQFLFLSIKTECGTSRPAADTATGHGSKNSGNLVAFVAAAGRDVPRSVPSSLRFVKLVSFEARIFACASTKFVKWVFQTNERYSWA